MFMGSALNSGKMNEIQPDTISEVKKQNKTEKLQKLKNKQNYTTFFGFRVCKIKIKTLE